MDKRDLIFKVLSEQATETELNELQHWILTGKANEEEFRNFETLWKSVRNTAHEKETKHSEGWRLINVRMNDRLRRQRWNRLAGYLFIILMITLLATWSIALLAP